MAKRDVLQPLDDDARRLAKTLLRGERHAALATLDPQTGGPAASRINVAAAISGAPIFLISRLSAHFGALEADPRAGLMLGSPGTGDPLAHPRLSLQGCATMLLGDAHHQARRRFLARHPRADLYADFADFAFWSLDIERASLNGGFARAYAPSADDLLLKVPHNFADMEADAVQHMNKDHADAIALFAERLLACRPGRWRIASIDPDGMDLIDGDTQARLWFEPPLATAEDLRPRLVQLAKAARAL
ncbi:MAG: DUF2470 domain-containing protein [Pseudomonadota bacterium]